jgi:tetratricopeptide (TPR) repeat protein
MRAFLRRSPHGVMLDPEFQETPGYEPSPLDMSGLERTSVSIPSRLLEEGFGYTGDRRYVSFHWSPRHQKLFVCDGQGRGQLSNSTVWAHFLAHPLIVPHLQRFSADYRRVEAVEFSATVAPLAETPLFLTDGDVSRMDADVVTSCLLLDRRTGDVYVGPWSGALNFHSLVEDETFEGTPSETFKDTVENVEERLMTWLDKHLDDPDQLFGVAATFHRFKQYRQSLDALLRCVQLRPESDEFHLRLSQVYADLDCWEEALKVCEKAVRLQAGAVKRSVTAPAIFMWLARCQLELKRYSEAADTYRLVTEVDPYLQGGIAYHQLGRCLSRLGRHKEAIAAHQTAVVRHAEEAAENMASMDELEPTEYDADLAEMDRGLVGDALEQLGKAHILGGQLREAEDAFRQALKASPNSVRAHGCLALVHNLMDKRSIAFEEFNIAAARARLLIDCHPDSASAHGDLAFVYKMMGDNSSAKQEYTRACERGWRTDPDEDLFVIAARLPRIAGHASDEP